MKPRNRCGDRLELPSNITRCVWLGVEHIFICNGHAGNGPLRNEVAGFSEKLGIDVRFHSYWEAYSKEFVAEHLESNDCPAHAAEFETSMALAAFPENAHWDGVDYDAQTFDIQNENYRDKDAPYHYAARDLATPGKGRIMIDEAANWVAEHLDPLAGTSATDKDRLVKTRAFSHQFAKRAFRRPLDAEQQRFFIDSRFAGRKPVTDSVKEVVLLTLKSPRFLYPDLGQADDYSVATRLALGLWDSMPDDELLRAAAAGRLNTPDEARQQALRMLRDSRSRAKLRDTFHHWLGIDHAEEIAKDTEQYPNYDKSLEADLRTSLNIFLDNIVWRTAGADFRKLLNSRHLPFNERLARFYGAQRVKHHGEFGPSFFDHERAGLLTHPYLLALYSYHNATSPIHRGVFITRHVLGRSLKPPPEAVVFKDEAFAPDMTMREKVTQLTKPDTCMTCHEIINPLGFALEQFDGIGRLRKTEKGRPINTISDYLSADGSAIRLTSAGDLARHATESPSAQNRFIEMLFNQVAKQPVRAYGSGVRNRLREEFVASGFNVQFLLAETAVINALHGVDTGPPAERN